MKTKIALGILMASTIGTAVASGLLLQKASADASHDESVLITNTDSHSVTPEMIAKWKATAATADYSPPMLPI
jgi:hypothetical protein